MKENNINIDINIADNDIDSATFATLNWVVRVGDDTITDPDCQGIHDPDAEKHSNNHPCFMDCESTVLMEMECIIWDH